MYDNDDDPLDCEIAQSNSFIGIGWRYMGDLTRFSEEERDNLKEELKRVYRDQKKGWYPQSAGSIIRFVDKEYGMDIDDIVILPTYSNGIITYLIGKIESPAYYIEKPQDGAHVKTRRKVKWITTVPRKEIPPNLRAHLNSEHTVYEISDEQSQKEIDDLLSGRISEPKNIEIKSKTDMIGKLSEIQKRLMEISPSEFEKFVCETLSLKYDLKAHKTRDVADGGIDFVCIDNLGNIPYKGQVKRVSSSIGNKDILQLRGTLQDNQEGIFVTTTYFTSSAIAEADSYAKKKIHLIDGRLLSQTILDVYEDLDENFKNILKIEK